MAWSLDWYWRCSQFPLDVWWEKICTIIIIIILVQEKHINTCYRHVQRCEMSLWEFHWIFQTVSQRLSKRHDPNVSDYFADISQPAFFSIYGNPPFYHKHIAIISVVIYRDVATGCKSQLLAHFNGWKRACHGLKFL